jgi:RNA polymerase sigma-70 factor (ECF subfamily)
VVRRNDTVPLELLAAAQAGDRRALERLLAQAQPRLYAYSKAMCRNTADAEDVMQEAMLAVVRSIGEFRGAASFSTWVFQIARSFCIKKRRRRTGQPAAFEPVDGRRLADDAPSAEAAAAGKELGRLLEAALRAMPAEAREVLVLRDVEGLSAAEVAAVLGTSVAAVKSKLHRARLALEADLAPRLGMRSGARTRKRTCPDVLRLYSKNLEGELTGSVCAELEAHVGECDSCRASCLALKKTLTVCRRTPVVPRAVQERVRAAVRYVLDDAARPRRSASREAR